MAGPSKEAGAHKAAWWAAPGNGSDDEAVEEESTYRAVVKFDDEMGQWEVLLTGGRRRGVKAVSLFRVKNVIAHVTGTQPQDLRATPARARRFCCLDKVERRPRRPCAHA